MASRRDSGLTVLPQQIFEEIEIEMLLILLPSDWDEETDEEQDDDEDDEGESVFHSTP